MAQANQPAVKPEVTPEDTLSAITISSRVPEFWKEQARLWFIQYESVVNSQRLSDEAKYNLVIAKLTREAIQQVSDILLAPPDTGKYQTLKSRLLEVFEESENKQFQKLLTDLELGDQKPSQLLRRMRDLARGKLPDDTLCIMWTGHLPPSIRAVLAVSEVKDLDNLAAVADKILETTRPIDVTEIAQQMKPQSLEPSLSAQLLKEIASLKLQVTKMQRFRPPRNNRSRNTTRESRSHSRDATRDSSRRRTPDSPDWQCYYHYKYGHKANKCVEPCNFTKKYSEN